MVLKELSERSDLQGLQAVDHLGLRFLTGVIAYTVFLRLNAANSK